MNLVIIVYGKLRKNYIVLPFIMNVAIADEDISEWNF